MPDRNILAIVYEEISKDPREALRITALNCQEQSVPLEDVLTRLLSSAGAAPMNRTVKMHSMESKTATHRKSISYYCSNTNNEIG